VSLAHGLGVSVVAEGIETAEQARRLRELGCDLGQGHYFSRALPADAIERLLAARRAAAERRLAGSPTLHELY
jgi:EAL domain-containing protein (putative c-di-GMP-specific phosphodiesterase class I)